MLIALITTILGLDSHNISWVIIAIIIGGLIGVRLANKVAMTEIQELVAILHSFIGLSAILVGFNSFISHDVFLNRRMENIHLIEIFLGIFIGAITFTGSIVAYGKLCGKIAIKPLMVSNRHKINLLTLLISLILLLFFIKTIDAGLQIFILLMMTIIALAFSWHLVSSIGGADMPVVVSMLNSYSGWAAATGFMLSNDLLIITGALVGSSGTILSYIICKAMNRSFISIIAGGFSINGILVNDKRSLENYRETTADEVAELLKNSNSVIIAPGYGMAVLQA